MAKRETKKKNKGSAGNNRKAGEAFLEKNLTKEGVVETNSGLQYLVVEEGEGRSPDEFSTVTVHQRAMLVDGKLIEDTFRTNETSTVPMAELIEGYQEGLMMMKEGGRSKFFVPSDLAWGRKGSGSKIPPYATIIFDVRLIKVDD